MSAVRTAAHDGFDRIVFELAGPDLPGYRVRYVDRAVQCGSGTVVTSKGAALLEISLVPAQAHTEEGVPAEVDRGGAHLIQNVVPTCDFEGHATWVIGLPGRLGFRVLELGSPARLVIDMGNADGVRGRAGEKSPSASEVKLAQ